MEIEIALATVAIGIKFRITFADIRAVYSEVQNNRHFQIDFDLFVNRIVIMNDSEFSNLEF